MRKNTKYILVSLLSFCFVVNVNAAECSYEKQVELNNIASTVKATYEAVDIDSGEKYYDGTFDENGNPNMTEYYVKGFKVKLLNLTNDLIAEVTNSLGQTRTITYADTNNGSVDLWTNSAENLITYTINIRATDGECGGTDLRTIDLLIPRYNYYSETSFCQNNPEFEYCQEFTTASSDIDLIKFDEMSKKYTEEKNKDNKQEKSQKNSFLNKIKIFFKEKGVLVFSIIGIVGVIIVVLLVIRKRRRLI